MKYAFVIAGTHSGVGKTTFTLGLIAALQEKGLSCQSFKVGPDYLDPGYHNLLTPGRRCRNLDSWLLPESYLRETFYEHARDVDVALVEGVMGLYDGRGVVSEEGSTAQVAKILGLPVVLIIDGQGVSRSAAALALGFKMFDPDVNLMGVLLNGVNGPRHFEFLRAPIEKAIPLKVIGYLPRRKEFEIPERHLGLQSCLEFQLKSDFFEKLGAQVLEQFDIEYLLAKTEYSLFRKPDKTVIASPKGEAISDSEIASPSRPLGARRPGGHPPLDQLASPPTADPRNDNRNGVLLGALKDGRGSTPTACAETGFSVGKVRIAVAYDEAFSFYYEDNFDLLRAAGAEILFFSPLHDEVLPDCDAVTLGGGFPESFAVRLSRNEGMKEALQTFAKSRRPIYAECGGLIYLVEKFVDANHISHDMIGLVPGVVHMTERLQSFGYKELTSLKETFLFPRGIKLRSHEFHYSRWDYQPALEEAAYRIDGVPNGFSSENILASYQHLHFGSHPLLAKSFVENTLKLKGQALESPSPSCHSDSFGSRTDRAR